METSDEQQPFMAPQKLFPGHPKSFPIVMEPKAPGYRSRQSKKTSFGIFLLPLFGFMLLSVLYTSEKNFPSCLQGKKILVLGDSVPERIKGWSNTVDIDNCQICKPISPCVIMEYEIEISFSCNADDLSEHLDLRLWDAIIFDENSSFLEIVDSALLPKLYFISNKPITEAVEQSLLDRNVNIVDLRGFNIFGIQFYHSPNPQEIGNLFQKLCA